MRIQLKVEQNYKTKQEREREGWGLREDNRTSPLHPPLRVCLAAMPTCGSAPPLRWSPPMSMHPAISTAMAPADPARDHRGGARTRRSPRRGLAMQATIIYGRRKASSMQRRRRRRRRRRRNFLKSFRRITPESLIPMYTGRAGGFTVRHVGAEGRVAHRRPE